jgi:hypothetical protein
MIEFQFVNGYIASPSNKVQPNGDIARPVMVQLIVETRNKSNEVMRREMSVRLISMPRSHCFRIRNKTKRRNQKPKIYLKRNVLNIVKYQNPS